MKESGLTLKEAIKSGDRFKRPSYLIFHRCHDDCPERFTREEVLADDWEVEEEKIEITKTQLFRAMDHIGVFSSLHAQKQLAKELGFK